MLLLGHAHCPVALKLLVLHGVLQLATESRRLHVETIDEWLLNLARSTIHPRLGLLFFSLTTSVRTRTHAQVTDGLDDVVAHKRCISVVIPSTIHVANRLPRKVLGVGGPREVVHHHVVLALLKTRCK